MKTLSIQVDSHLYTAEVPLGATLYQFFSQAGRDCGPDSLFSDGTRAFSARLEMAFRHHGARLSSVIPDEMMRQLPALTPDSLLAAADR